MDHNAHSLEELGAAHQDIVTLHLCGDTAALEVADINGTTGHQILLTGKIAKGLGDAAAHFLHDSGRIGDHLLHLDGVGSDLHTGDIDGTQREDIAIIKGNALDFRQTGGRSVIENGCTRGKETLGDTSPGRGRCHTEGTGGQHRADDSQRPDKPACISLAEAGDHGQRNGGDDGHRCKETGGLFGHIHTGHIADLGIGTAMGLDGGAVVLAAHHLNGRGVGSDLHTFIGTAEGHGTAAFAHQGKGAAHTGNKGQRLSLRQAKGRKYTVRKSCHS